MLNKEKKVENKIYLSLRITNLNSIGGDELINKVLKDFEEKKLPIFKKRVVYQNYDGTYLIILEQEESDKVKEFLNTNVVMMNNKNYDLLYKTTILRNIDFDINDEEAFNLIEDLEEELIDDLNIYEDSEDFKMRLEVEKFILENPLESFIEAYFQKVMNIKTNKIYAFEALARMNLNNEVISPAIFLPILKRHSLMLDLDKLMIKKSGDFYNYLISSKVKGVSKYLFSINISASSLCNDKNTYIQEDIKNISIPNKQIIVELTEDITLSDYKIKQLKQLKKIGVHIAIDDFIMGNTSIRALNNVEIDIIKLDKSLVKELSFTTDNLFLKELNQFIKKLGKTIIIEGVETKKRISGNKRREVYKRSGFLFL